MRPCLVDKHVRWDLRDLGYLQHVWRAKSVDVVRCTECGRKIAPDEAYELSWNFSPAICWMENAEYSTFRTCRDCESARAAFFCAFHYCHVWEDLRNAIRENDGKIRWEAMRELTPSARGMVCDILEEVWEGLGEQDAQP
jgi:hypothetical protein